MMSSLLMLSNVVALLVASRLAMSAKVTAKVAAEMAMSTKAEMAALMALQFSEPLPQVLARARKTAKTMHIREALQTKVASRMPREITTLLQDRNTTHTGSMRSLVKRHHSGLQDDKTLNKAMAFINGEYVQCRESLDLKLLECGFFKIQKEQLLSETQDKLDEIAMDMGLASATTESCQGTISEQNSHIEKKSAEMSEVQRQCRKIGDELTEARDLVQADLDVINLIMKTTKEECVKMGVTVAASFMTVHACVDSNGQTFFKADRLLFQEKGKFKTTASQRAFQRVLFDMYGMDKPLPGKLNLQLLDDFDDEDDADDFPAALTSAPGQSFIQLDSSPVGTSTAVSKSDSKERCSGVGGKPDCRKLLDKLDQMRGEIMDRLQEATKELQKHDTECELTIADINKELSVARDIVFTTSAELQKASAFHNGLSIQHGQNLAFKTELCDELRGGYQECYKTLKELEREMCGLLQIRQAVYNRAKNPDGKKPQLMIQDCEMSDWTVGACSSTCIDIHGRPGVQLITRTKASEWSNTTPEGKYGAPCPPDVVDRDCATEHCPVDCVMEDWSGWSECTAPCGGGQFSRARGIKVHSEHGGKLCGATSVTEQCNTGSCDRDCVLSDWSAWSPCSRSCKGKSSWAPGMMTRTKHIAEPTKGAGMCWEPNTEQRFDHSACNNFVCPKKIECVSDLDVVMVQDGSGSLWYPWKGKAHWDRNFELSKTFILELLGMSKMATADANGNVKGGLRYGVVLYSFNPRVVSQVTHDKAKLTAAVKAMKWPMGGTMTGRALLKAKQLFLLAPRSSKRLQVIVLVTDGRASNRYWAYQAAYLVRNSGIRLVVVPVKGALRNEADMCSWASKPCGQNMIMTPQWTMLISKLRLYLTTLCPTVEVPATR